MDDRERSIPWQSVSWVMCSRKYKVPWGSEKKNSKPKLGGTEKHLRGKDSKLRSIELKERGRHIEAGKEIGVCSHMKTFALQEERATSSSILAWRIPRTEEPGGLYRPWGHTRVWRDWATNTFFTSMVWPFKNFKQAKGSHRFSCLERIVSMAMGWMDLRTGSGQAS